jgi:Phosphotransferase enzyme family
MESRFAQRALDLLPKLHLLEKLPPVLTHLDFAEVNIMVDRDTGHLTGVLDFDGARTEAFGMCIFGGYEGFFGVMRDARWSFFDQPLRRDHPKPDPRLPTVRQVLEAAFWDTLWNSVPPWMERSELEEPVSVALDLEVSNRYFDKDSDVDPEDEDGMRAVNWATGLLLDR